MIDFRKKTRQALLWSQQYTQTDMIYLARGGFWLTVGQIVSIVTSFLLAIAFANFLPKESYGQYQYILSIIAILTIFSLPGMNTAVTQAVARGREGSFIAGLKTRIYWGLLAGIISFVLAVYYLIKNNVVLATSLTIGALFLPLLDSLTIFHGYLKGKKLFDFLTKYTSIIELVTTGCLLVALFMTNNIFLILLVYFISYTGLRFIFSKVVIKKFPPNEKEESQAISFGKHLSLMYVATLIASRLDHILLWHFLGAAEVAIYSFAILLPQKIVNLFSGTIRPLILPKASGKKSTDLKNSIPKKATQLFLILIPLVVVYIVLAPLFYRLFFPKYLDSIFYSQVFALSILLVPELLFSTSLIAQMEKKKLYVYKFSSALVQIISLLILVPPYGILGAVVAILFTQASNLGLSIFLFREM